MVTAGHMMAVVACDWLPDMPPRRYIVDSSSNEQVISGQHPRKKKKIEEKNNGEVFTLVRNRYVFTVITGVTRRGTRHAMKPYSSRPADRH